MDMSDAKKALKVAAARLTVKKESADAAIAGLQARRAELKDGLAQARSAGETQLAEDVADALSGVESQLDSQLELQATIESSLQQALQEYQGVDGLKSQLDRAELQATVGRLSTSDPFAPSAEDRALQNARSGIGDLDAQAQLQRELGADARQIRDVEDRLAALRNEDPEAKARAQLAALKAARTHRTPTPSEAESDAGPSAVAPKKPKRTL